METLDLYLIREMHKSNQEEKQNFLTPFKVQS